MPLHIAVVAAERELVNVAMQVLVAGVMVDAVQPALQDGPNALNAVGRHAVIPHLLARAVHNGRVLVVTPKGGRAAVRVGIDRRPGVDARAAFPA